MIIWWLTQPDCEAIGDLPDAFPEDARDMYNSRLGRSGRGRLWLPPGVKIGVDPWPDTPLAKFLERQDAGGLVLDRSILPLLAELPGLATDMQLRRV